jgi:hypothetical protein
MGVERLIGLRSTKNHAIALTIPIGAETDDKDKMGLSRWPKNLMQFDRQEGFSPISSRTMEPPAKRDLHPARFFDAAREILEFF